MNRDRKYFTILYCLIVLVDIIGLIWFPEIRVATKPLIVTSLLGFYILREKSNPNHLPNNLFLTGLIFALLGDIFLNSVYNEMFIMGLGAFLIMQLLFSAVFYQDKTKHFQWKPFLLILFFAIVFNYILWDFTDKMRWPVCAYSAALSWMVFTAISRKQEIKGYKWVFTGAALFIISDSLLGLHKFYAAHLWLSVLIMLTYTAAQYLMVLGYKMKQERGVMRE